MKKTVKRILLRALLIMVISTSCWSVVSYTSPQAVYAENNGGHSWTEEADQSIYGDDQSLAGDEETTEKEDPNWFEKLLSFIVRSLGKGFNSLLSGAGASLDRIICGRVASNGEKTAMFTFELIDGNPYGTIGAITFSVIRGMVIIWMIFILLAKLNKAIWSNGNGAARNNFKEGVMTFLLSFCLLFAMPYLLDLVLYLRDQVLWLLLKAFSNVLGDSTTLSLTGSFLKTAEESETITDAIMYLGAVVVSLLFIFDYTGMALAMLIMFVLFGFTVVQMNLDKTAVSGWCKNVFSTVITPVIDLILMFVPLFLSVMFPDMWLLKIVVCMCIIPARRTAKNVLGLSSPGEGIMNAMTALALAHTASNAKRSLGRKMHGIGEKVKNGIADNRSAKYEQDMANAEALDEQEMMAGNGYALLRDGSQYHGFGKSMEQSGDMSKSGAQKSGVYGISGQDKKGAQEIVTDQNAEDMYSGSRGSTSESLRMGVESEAAKNDRFDTEDGAVEDRFNGARRNARRNANGKFTGMDADSDTYSASADLNSPALSRNEIQDQLNNEKRDLTEENNQHRLNVGSLKSQKAALEQKNAELHLDDEVNRHGVKSHNQEIAENNKKIAEINKEIADTNQKMDKNSNRISDIDNSLKRMNMSNSGVPAGVGGGSGRGSGGSSLSDRQRAVMEAHASIDNFEQPEFSALSHAKKAELYRKRAKKQFKSAAAATAAVGVGATVGAAIGGGAGMFYGPQLAAAGVVGGFDVASGSVVEAGAYVAGSVIGKPISGGLSAARSGINHIRGKAPVQQVNTTPQYQNVTQSIGNDTSSFIAGAGSVPVGPAPTAPTGGNGGAARVIPVAVSGGTAATSYTPVVNPGVQMGRMNSYGSYDIPQVTGTYTSGVASAADRINAMYNANRGIVIGGCSSVLESATWKTGAAQASMPYFTDQSYSGLSAQQKFEMVHAARMAYFNDQVCGQVAAKLNIVKGSDEYKVLEGRIAGDIDERMRMDTAVFMKEHEFDGYDAPNIF